MIRRPPRSTLDRSSAASDVYKRQIELCPVVVIPPHEIETIDKTVIYNYYFLWQNNQAAIALGYGSLYNHSYDPNAEYIMDYEGQILVCLLYTSPSPRDRTRSRMPSSA